jgi:hypothetical protein
VPKLNNIGQRVCWAFGGLALSLCTACSNVGYTEKIPNDPFNAKIDHGVSSDTRNAPPITMENADMVSIPLQGGLFTIDVSLMFPPESAKSEYGVVSINPKKNPKQEQNVAVVVQPVENSGGRIVPITVSPRQPNTNAKPDTYVVAVLGGQVGLTFQANLNCPKLSVVGRDLANVPKIYAGVKNAFPDHFLGLNTAAASDAAVSHLHQFLGDPNYPKRVYSVTCGGRPAANVMIMAKPDQKGSEQPPETAPQPPETAPQPPETAPETLWPPFAEDLSLVGLLSR